MSELDSGVFDQALRMMWDQHPDGLFISGLDGRVLEANDALLERVGYTREQLVDGGFMPEIEERDESSVEVEYAATVLGEQRHFAMTGVRSDGARFRVEVTTIPLRVADTVIGVLGIARDLAALEGALAARQAVEERFEKTLNSISDGIYFLDREFRFTYLNPRAEQISRRTREDLTGKTLWDEFPEVRGSEFGIAYLRAAEERVSLIVRERYDPLAATLEVTVYPSDTGLALYVRDVSDEEEARALVRERDRRIASQAALLDTTGDAMVVRGLDHTINYWNRGAQLTYGWTAEEATGRSIRDLLYDDPTAFDAATATVMETGEWIGDIEQQAKDGRVIIASCRWSLVRDINGEPEAIFAVNSDVTERRRADEEASREQRMKSLGTLAGGIAHDLNNVLTPLLMSVQLLSAEETDESKLQTLAVVENSVKRGAEMIRQVLAFARGVDGRRIPVHLARLVDDTLAFCHETLPPDIEVRSQIDADVDTIGDPTQLLQVLVNLVTNARDVMPDGGTITISVSADTDRSKPGQRVVIAVQDTGPGIAEDVAGRMFEPFFTTKDVGVGTGLGLAICAAIVRSHGGEMRASSEPGSGARFEMVLPAVHHADGTAAHGPASSPRGHGELILIVDDEAAIRSTARKVLEKFGYRTAVAAHGGEAIAYLERFPGAVSLVLSDVSMPVLDGVAAAGRYGDVPVLFMSGRSVDDGYLSKPFSAHELLTAVADRLGPSAL